MIQIQSLLSIALTLVWIGSKQLMRNEGFKFAIVGPILILIDLSTSIGVIWDESKILSTNISDNPQFVTTGYIELFIIPIIIVVFIFKYILNLMDPFSLELTNLYLEVEAENYDVRITNQDMLSNSTFGPMSMFINRLLEKSNTLISDLKNTVKVMETISDELIHAADLTLIATEEVNSSSQSMASGASSQTERIHSALEEMHKVNTLVSDIIDQIKKSTDNTSQIALQTNILALNAGIEASRAGDYGRGFAVVAENVRKLSDQSKIASENINNIVETISISLQDLFNNLQQEITGIAAVSEETAASSEEVAASSEEMRANIDTLLAMANKLKQVN